MTEERPAIQILEREIERLTAVIQGLKSDVATLRGAHTQQVKQPATKKSPLEMKATRRHFDDATKRAVLDTIASHPGIGYQHLLLKAQQIDKRINTDLLRAWISRWRTEGQVETISRGSYQAINPQQRSLPDSGSALFELAT